MAQSSGPISQGTTTERQFSDVIWRNLFGDEPGVLSDMDGTAYALTLPGSGDVVSVGSATQASIAMVAGFAHTIPVGTPEPITIPVASGSSRTDIIGLRYDPAYTGLPGPVRLYRTAGTSSAIPTYDAAPPGVEDLPLWAITRAPGAALSAATVVRMFPRRAPLLEVATTSPLPSSSPLGTVARQGAVKYVRQLVSGSPAWVIEPVGQKLTRYLSPTASGTLNGTVNLLPPISLPAAPFGPGVKYQIEIDARVMTSQNPGLGVQMDTKVGSTVIGGDEFTNGGTQGNTVTLKAKDVIDVADDLGRTITISLTSLGGQIAVYGTYGRVIVTATPRGDY